MQLEEPVKISGEIVAMALNATQWHRSEVQGFTYPHKDGTQSHVVRDCTKPAGEQLIWQETAPKSDYEAAHARMLLAKERAEADIVAERINILISARR
jgi:hypothetical protein